MRSVDQKTLFATAETIMLRLPILWWQLVSPSASGRAEMSRMVSEKQQAAIDGVFAAQAQLIDEALRFGWLNPIASWQRVARAAFRPAARKARANARRLSRR